MKCNCCGQELPAKPDLELAPPPGGLNGSAVAYIPILGGEYPVTQVIVDELEKCYPAVDVLQTLNEIRGWNISNPKQRKTKSGVLRHINAWMTKVQNSG